MKIGVGALIIFLSEILYAQNIFKFEPSKPIHQSSIEQWTTARGLTSNNLVQVLQSTSGYLWICTYDGLLRFDGHSFEVFDRENIPFLKSNAFYRSYEDSKGRLWLTTQASGIVVYENNTFSSLFTNSILPTSIRCLLFRSNNEVYVGSNSNGLFRIKDSVITKIEHPLFNNISIMDIVEDSKNNIWVATNGNGIVNITESKFEVINTTNGLSSDVINSLALANNNRLLIGTTRGFNALEDGKIKKFNISIDLQINDIITDPFNAIWLATERGLIRINENNGVEELFSNEQGLPALTLTSLTFDIEGSLWLTSNKAGLIRMKDSGIITYHQAQGLSMDLANIAYEDIARKQFLLGSDGGDVDIVSNGKIKRFESSNLKKNIGIRDFCIDQKGNLWIASYNGLIKKSTAGEKVFNTSNSLPSQEIRRIMEDKSGALWLATRSGGIIRMKDDKVNKVFNQRSGLKANYIMAIEENRFGTKFIGTNGGGLYLIDPNDSVKAFNLTNDDSGVLIFNIHIDEDGTAWLVTSIGIFLFDGNSFRQVPIKANQKGEVYFDWIEDDFGNIWISSNRGILRVQLKDILSFKRGDHKLIMAKIYGVGDGMRNRECTGTTRMLKSTSGEIWVPTLGGFSVINPKELSENQFVPPVYITKIETDDSTYFTNGKTIIEPGNLRYTFHYTALSLATPEKNHFRYKLEGENDDWFTTSERSVTYTNLPPGDYTFYVQASNNDGIWNEKGTSISFTVEPFVYQSKTFRIIGSILLLTILIGIYKWRINDIQKRNRELQKVNAELDKFVYSASHDLRAPLASVLGIVNIARIDKDEVNQANYLNLIEKSIKKLDGFINDIINFSRNARIEITNQEIDFEKIINEVFDDLRYLDENGRVSRHVSAVGTGKFFTDPLRVKIILSNLISNAFKYHNLNGKNPFIEVKIKYDSHVAIIKVTDNGQGIAKEHVENIFKMFYRASENSKGSGIGLYIVKETLDKIKGKIEVNSTIGTGTEFEIILPSFKG